MKGKALKRKLKAMSVTDRRTFLALAAAGVSGLGAGPAMAAANPWKDAVIVNALGGLDNPNVPSDAGSGLGPSGPR